MKKFLVFVLVAVAVFCAIGCVVMAVSEGYYLMAAGVVIVDAFAFPKIRDSIKYILS